jgi:NitT/TauT family transport system ATP-binding protein
VLSSRPGRLKQVVEIDLGARGPDQDLRSDPHFVRYRHEVWNLLHDEVHRAEDASHGKILPDGTERVA